MNRKKKKLLNLLRMILTAMAIGIGLFVPARYYAFESKLDKEYDRLMRNGKQITDAMIIEYKSSNGSLATKDWSRKGGIQVEVEYKDDSGNTQRLSEIWPLERGQKIIDKKREKVTVFYNAENDVVKAASVENPRFQTAAKIIENELRKKGAMSNNNK